MEIEAMRLTFGKALCELGSAYPNLVVLDADVSSSTQTKLFGQMYPDRFFNFGIAEANMMSAAAGMASCGLIPVVSSFAFLLTLRSGDPVRSLIAYNRLNVKIAGGYAGLSDAADGASHQSILDLSVMRAMPHMTVLVPSDRETTRGAVRAMLDYEGPVYIRLSRHETGSCHLGSEAFEIGKARVIREGKDAVAAVTGSVLKQVMDAAERLEAEGIRITLLEFPTLKPFDRDTLLRYAKGCRHVFTIEENSVIGGLGSAVCEQTAENRVDSQVVRIGIEDCFGESGSYEQLLERHGLSADAIYAKIKETVRR